MAGESTGARVAVAATVIVVAGLVAGLWWWVSDSAQKKVRPPAVVTWKTSASRYRSQVGKSIAYRCPPKGRPGAVWGSGPYTSDSSVCTAAVHAGLISFRQGGKVTIAVSLGQQRYEGSQRHGVRTGPWGHHRGSFYFKQARPVPLGPEASAPRGPLRATWTTTPVVHRQRLGQKIRYRCPPKGAFAKVWGSGLYTLDSSVCTAAAHAGAISRDKGGLVTIEIQRGRSQYSGSLRNGVQTGRWKAYHTSFRVQGAALIDALPAPE